MITNVTTLFKDELKWIRENCKEIIPSLDNNLV